MMTPQDTQDRAALLRRGMGLHTQGDLDGAARHYAAILARDPMDFDALHLLGVTHLQRGALDQAVQFIERAVGVNSTEPAALNNGGYAHALAGRHAEALKWFDRAIAVKPDYAEAFYNRGNVYKDIGNHTDAAVAYRRAVALKPDYLEAYRNLGIVLEYLGRWDEAIGCYETAIAKAPRDPIAHFNRALLLRHLGRLGAARQGFATAIALAPTHAEAHFALAECRLLAGEYPAGWEEFEWRWATPGLAPRKRAFSRPLWLGAGRVDGKTMLLHAEQGFGDTLLYCRFAKAVTALGARVILEVQPELKRLLSRCQGAAEVIAAGEPLPDFDLHCPLASLPWALKVDLNSLAKPVPYLAADPDLAAPWRRRLANEGGLACGLVWSARVDDIAICNRSILLSQLSALEHSGARFFGLQPNILPRDQTALASFRSLTNIGDQFTDFADTAAAISALDLVITADTAVAHLAGGLGKPVWVLVPFSPDWRWMRDRDDSPWYPTARLFRQPAIGDWATVAARVAAEIRIASRKA